MRVYVLMCDAAHRAFLAKKSHSCEDMGWGVHTSDAGKGLCCRISRALRQRQVYRRQAGGFSS
jgi:hypothetical protein